LGEGTESTQEFPERGAQFLPMMCQQCEAAPCEIVCPVGATHHTPDGLNSQVYNRCIGSRYCSANCPTRFDISTGSTTGERLASPLEQQLNPDVTVRSKGVMEKCTFCVQRLTEAKDRARTEKRTVRDGEVLTACAQACPTSAIHFGNMADSSSAVARMWKAQQVELSADRQAKDDQRKSTNSRARPMGFCAAIVSSSSCEPILPSCTWNAFVLGGVATMRNANSPSLEAAFDE